MSSFTFAVVLASTLASMAPVVAALVSLLAQVSVEPKNPPKAVDKLELPVNRASYLSENSCKPYLI